MNTPNSTNDVDRRRLPDDPVGASYGVGENIDVGGDEFEGQTNVIADAKLCI